RNGTASPFMIFAPLEGKDDAIVTDHPTAMDYAQTLKHISDTVFPDAEKIPSVTHKPAALYQAFPPQEARRLVERFEWHDTPRHGSWLDLAECALGVPSSLCLSRRIPDMPTFKPKPQPGSPTAISAKPKPIGASQ